MTANHQRVDVERLSESIRMIEGCRVFVTTREKIKHPEGTDLFDESVRIIADALPALLQQLAERDAECERLREYVREADRRVGEQFMAAQRAEAEALRTLNKCGEAFDRTRSAERAREGAESKVAELMAQRDELIACTCGCSRKSCPECGAEINGPLSWLDPNDPTVAAFLAANGGA